MFQAMVLATRIVLGVFYLASGLNWFFGFIPMLPHVGMPPDLPIKHALVVEMIATGWLFQLAKIMELVFGFSLLANRAVPLTLAATLPVAFITFMLDALILDDIIGWLNGSVSIADLNTAIADMVIGGLCVLLPHLWLMICYRQYYAPAFAWRAEAAVGGQPDASAGTVWTKALLMFGAFALLLQAYNLYLFLGMVRPS